MGLAIVAAILYIALVYLLWRVVPFTQPRKAVFSLTMPPIFVAAMLLNMWLLDTWLNGAFEAVTGWLAEPHHRSHAVGGALLTLPIAALVSTGWYRLFRQWEGRARLRADE